MRLREVVKWGTAIECGLSYLQVHGVCPHGQKARREDLPVLCRLQHVAHHIESSDY